MCGFLAALIVAGKLGLGIIVALTLILVVMYGTLVGAMLPLFFKRVGLDPALMSNPFVAGIVDISGILIYMNVALALMSAFPVLAAK